MTRFFCSGVRRLTLVLVAVAGFAGNAALADEPSVLVTTVPVTRGALKHTITAYGHIAPGAGAARTLTTFYEAVVTAIDARPGMAVRKGQVIARIAAAAATRAAYAQAVAARDGALRILAHTRALLAQHLATRIQLAQAEQAAQAARATLDALKREGADRATAAVEAPFAGIVTAISTAPGAALQPGTAIATVVRRAALVAVVGVDPAAARRLAAGQPASVSVFGGAVLRGRIDLVSGEVDPRTGLVDATVGLGAAQALIGGMVRARIDTGTVRGVIVPRDAALPAEGREVIWQIRDGHAVRVIVHVLASAHGESIVAGPVDPSLPVVVAGNAQLQPGIAVRVQAEPGY
ncbi:MAG TPA: efflux RND transporter periplasmic adaptor subunit [Acidiphilium sp.]|uniref:efflux RND transporter periplasmic adaptor subunit n=1 Tax=unclassified Acidiphilium TaxID=2617493 RepID=UPI000BCEB36A|nr:MULTISPECIES: efflux RND transporter periplasmic adaptor subunit [unclassified Acidiphilium]OYV57716.1 MAG: efflux transporter periplasmic adaptor subunit [Acidiphilium sp. 20-67-58]HQT60018.1 efflux RND transporter periplasmic adaptor subunit [Acidiphilium sp.]HQU11516.1 efflux RND transporter periplasmic adaptor subunit [Acidiphilium sp.]